jgi:hypothetical protein
LKARSIMVGSIMVGSKRSAAQVRHKSEAE